MDIKTISFEIGLAVVMLFIGAILSPRINNAWDKYWGQWSISSRKRNAKTIQQEYSRIQAFHLDHSKFYIFAVFVFTRVIGLLFFEIAFVGLLVYYAGDNTLAGQIFHYFNFGGMTVTLIWGASELTALMQTALRLTTFGSYSAITYKKLVKLSFITAEDETFITKVYENIPEEIIKRWTREAELGKSKQELADK